MMGFEDCNRVKWFDSTVMQERSDGYRMVTHGIAACTGNSI
jgi:hypothetical protein